MNIKVKLIDKTNIVIQIMGLLLSREETVYTIWKKHEEDIKEKVRELSKDFVKQYCSTEPDDYMQDGMVLMYAFNEYLSKKMDIKWYDSYMYYTSTYDRYKLLFGDKELYPHVRTVSGTSTIIGVCLKKWILP